MLSGQQLKHVRLFIQNIFKSWANVYHLFKGIENCSQRLALIWISLSSLDGPTDRDTIILCSGADPESSER